ncbi:hypothetical protein AB0M39_06980 [Streptomyces sp. NPDC051907]|uniref:hypothetical protein n=1 Tax=Streptomyces sp. NPDC051907 TaxID=3155284 RepID=UPI0034232731
MQWTSITRSARRSGRRPASGVPGWAVRAGLFSAVGTGLAVTGHHLASGHTVPWRAGVLGGLALFLVALPLVRTARSLPVVMLATLANQGLLHLWFEHAQASLPHHSNAPHGSDGAWHAGRHGLSMAAAHLLAALIVAWLMHRADIAVRSVVRHLAGMAVNLLARLLPRGLRAAARCVAPHLLRARPVPPSQSSLVLAYVVVRRGPPGRRTLPV